MALSLYLYSHCPPLLTHQSLLTLGITILTYANLAHYARLHVSTYLSQNVNILICNVYLYSTTTHLRLSEDPRINRAIMFLLYFFYYDPVIYQVARNMGQLLYV